MDHSATLSESAESSIDRFTPEFKRLKAKKRPPNLEKVIDLHLFSSAKGSCLPDQQENQIVRRHLVQHSDLEPIAGLRSCKEWVVLELLANPGFFVILNPFIPGYQRYWASRCVLDFPSDKANITNMTGQPGFDPQDAWNNFTLRSTFEKNDPLRKLRWTTLGYHYDWNTKEYSESSKADFPTDVYLLSEYIAASLGFGLYKAQAAIVNYYHMDSTLAGHTDHSEVDLAAPLISISFGQTAIFLLGGDTKSVEPLAMYLRSGDICVMSKHSRLAYHAVPKILSAWSEEENQRLKEAFTFCEPVPTFDNHGTCDSTSTDAEQSLAETERVSSRAASPESHTAVTEISDNSQVQTSKCEALATDNGTSPDSKHLHRPEIFHCDSGCDETISSLDSDNAPYHSIYKLRLDKVNSQILEKIATLNFKPHEQYLASSRINLNIRQVLPLGCETLPLKTEDTTQGQNKRFKMSDAYS